MTWRRFSGAVLMVAGAAALSAMLLLAAIVIANYVEWENAADALGTVALITLPPAAAGGALIVAGRGVYGNWHRRAPLRRASAWVVRIAGAALTVVLGAMFLFLMAAGAGPEDRYAAISLGLGTIGGLAVSFLGFWMRPRRKRPTI